MPSIHRALTPAIYEFATHNLTGSGIDGGISKKVAKGDFILVPEGTPHWFSTIDGTLTLMSLHLPRTR